MARVCPLRPSGLGGRRLRRRFGGVCDEFLYNIKAPGWRRVLDDALPGNENCLRQGSSRGLLTAAPGLARATGVTERGAPGAVEGQDIACEAELTLGELFDFLKSCHQQAPFLFFNGNTFATIGRRIMASVFQVMAFHSDFGMSVADAASLLGVTLPSRIVARELRTMVREVPAGVELWVGGAGSEHYSALFGARGLVLRDFDAFLTELTRVGGRAA